MKDFTDKVAAITGAGSGIGRGLALRLAAEGCHLALSDINDVGLKETAELIAQASPGVTVTTSALDVADEAAVFAWAEEVVADHGKVNLVFNNAGVAQSGTVAGNTMADYRWVMDINFWGVVYGTKAFLPHLEAAGDGHVVNVSSVFGLTAQPLVSAYNASKYAVRGFTESLRQDLELAGSPVSTTCVHPGGIRTNIAKTARVNDSVEEVTGRTDVLEEFDKLLHVTPDDAAKTILNGVKRNRRRVLIGAEAYAFDALVRIAPTGYQRIFTAAVKLRSKRSAR